MKEFRIGIMAEGLRLGLEGGIRRAAAIGAQGVQLYAVDGEFHPGIPAARKAELRRLIEGEGLVVTALCSEMGGFAVRRSENPRKLEETKRILEFAREMGTGVVTAHIGIVPSDASHPVWGEMQDILGRLGEFGASVGATFAIETGPEPAVVLRSMLDTISGVGVNLDPANLAMVTGDDPVAAVGILSRYIVHTHAKDGVMLRHVDPHAVYGDEESPKGEGPSYREVPLGQGSVDFPRYLAALESIGYDGFLTIEREVGDDPEADIRTAVRFLKDLFRA